MLNIWKTIAGTSADKIRPFIFLFPFEISEKTLVLGLLLQEGFDLPEKLLLCLIWHQVTTLRGNLLRTGWRWSSRKKLSADQDKSQVFSWSRPSPSFQLIKTWTKSSTVILSNPLSFTTSLQASFTCTYLLSAQGEFIKSSFADLAWSFHPHSSNLTASCKYTKVYEKLILKFSFSV